MGRAASRLGPSRVEPNSQNGPLLARPETSQFQVARTRPEPQKNGPNPSYIGGSKQKFFLIFLIFKTEIVARLELEPILNGSGSARAQKKRPEPIPT